MYTVNAGSFIIWQYNSEIPPQPSNTSFVRSDEGNFLLFCVLLHAVSGGGQQKPQPRAGFPQWHPPTQTHTLCLPHIHDILLTPPHTKPFFPLLPHTPSSVSWKETFHGRYFVCVCVCMTAFNARFLKLSSSKSLTLTLAAECCVETTSCCCFNDLCLWVYLLIDSHRPTWGKKITDNFS